MCKTPYISIIIPVYNAAQYINKCLDSIWQQGLDETLYEVICVNDCSIDNSLEIIANEQKHHKNLKLLSNLENLRAGGARNNGVRESKGEYICFIDADDYFHYNGLKCIVNYLLNNSLDILMYDWVRETPEGVGGKTLMHYKKNQSVMSGEAFLLTNSCPFGPCNYAFKRSLMVDNNCWFAEKVSTEDVDWSLGLALHAHTMQYQPILVSHVVIYPNSITGQEHSSVQFVIDKMLAGDRLFKLALKYKGKISVYKHLELAAQINYDRGLKMMFLVTGYGAKKNAIKQIPEALVNSYSKIISVARRFPEFYAWISDIFSPLFIFLLMQKRKHKSRVKVM